MNELSSWLTSLRRESRLSLAALAEKTKITPRHLEALEKGELEAFPSVVHARAFALAFARACGADDDEAAAKLNAALSPKKTQGSPRAGAVAVTAPLPAKAVAVPQKAVAVETAATSAVEPSSPLPWKLWAVVAACAVAFLFLLHTVVSCVRGAPAPRPLAIESQAAPGPLSSTAGAAAEEFSLRSRRPCWVLLVIDGQRLPVVLLEPHKKENWVVRQKAVMLAGNIGAVRVWWRGDNLGYFGELGSRMNGIVFEVGKPWRKDPLEDLALPPGVPSQAQK